MDIVLNFIFFVTLVIGILYLIRIPVLKGKLCAPLRPWYLLIFPPEDLYAFLAETTIIPDESNKVYRFEFSAKYIGTYQIGFITAERIPLPSYDSSYFALSLHVQFKVGDKILLSPFTTKMQSSWWGREETGFILHIFRIPEDVPLDEIIQCEIQIASTSYGYFTLGKEIKIYIKKHTEK
jgi:hypothetical protein